MSGNTVSPIATLGSRVIQNVNLKIDRSTCALNEDEEKELLSTRNVQRKRELVDLGKERANAISLVNNYFDAPIENISQELDNQGDSNIKGRVEDGRATTTEEALYSCSSICEVQRFTLASAYATVRQYTHVHDSQDGRYFYPPDESAVNLDDVVKTNNYEEGFSIAAKAIESLRKFNERTLAEVIKK
jgi:hypothetical protein